MTTKNDLYAFLTAAGVERGYCTLPEFCVLLPDRRKKEIDLVWAVRRRKGQAQDTSNLAYWRLTAAFEIEGCNVRRLPNEFNRHVRDFPCVRNVRNEPIEKFVVLYNRAYDRAWRAELDREQEVADRLRWDTGGAFTVVDGRKIDAAVARLPHARRQRG